jgi:hypothetical protein
MIISSILVLNYHQQPFTTMTSAPPNTPEMMNARLSESFWDNPPYDTQSVTPDPHELSTYSIHPISQQEMPTASMPKGKPWDAPTGPSPSLENLL